MKHTAVTVLSCLILVSAGFWISARWSAAGFQARDWEDPAVFKRNQEEAHTPLMPYQTVEEALRHERRSSVFYRSLNGIWKFNLAEVPEASPADFGNPAYDDSRWSEIRVPGNWQMQGFDHPLFRNVHQPFPATPPYPPSNYNPVGCYRRGFTIPESWAGRTIFLHFEGVHSASYVWINGQMVGYNEGGMEPAEYNISSRIRSRRG